MNRGLTLLRFASGCYLDSTGRNLQFKPILAGAFILAYIASYALPQVLLGRLGIFTLITPIAFSVSILVGLLLSRSKETWDVVWKAAALKTAFSLLVTIYFQGVVGQAIAQKLFFVFPSMCVYLIVFFAVAKQTFPTPHPAVPGAWLALGVGYFAAHLAYSLTYQFIFMVMEEESLSIFMNTFSALHWQAISTLAFLAVLFGIHAASKQSLVK